MAIVEGVVRGVVDGVMCGGGGAAANSLLTDLVAWYSLNEASGTRADSHTGSLDLTDNNTVGSAAGKVSNAASMVALSVEHLSVVDAAFNANNRDFSCACWVNLTDKVGPRAFGSCYDGAGDAAADHDWMALYWSATDRFRLYVPTGSTWHFVQADNLGSPTAGAWYHIYCQYTTATQELKIIGNDGTADTATGGATSNNVGTALHIGRYGSTQAYMNGLIDEWAFWSRHLTAAEITSLYNSGSGMGYPG